MGTYRFTYDGDPLYPKDRTRRLAERELQELPVEPPKPDIPRRRPAPKAVRDSMLRAAIRSDLARGLSVATIMSAYGVSELEVQRARKAGA